MLDGVGSTSNKNFAQGPEMPLGLGLALAQNVEAMNRFAAMPRERQREIIAHTHEIRSSAEMRAYVALLAEN